jgi:CheY-like chemotaxis protein
MSRSSLPVSAHTSPRVLVIDDHPDTAETLKEILDLSGVPAAVAHSGAAGVAWALEHAPAAVVSDIGMPGMDGFGVAAQLRTLAAGHLTNINPGLAEKVLAFDGPQLVALSAFVLQAQALVGLTTGKPGVSTGGAKESVESAGMY